MLVRTALAALLVATPIALSAQAAAPQPTLTSAGAGQYEVWCKVTPTSGEETIRYLQPGRASLSLAKVRRAECNYKAAAGGALTVTLVGPEWTCPFAGVADGSCEGSFPASTFGTFELKRKAR